MAGWRIGAATSGSGGGPGGRRGSSMQQAEGEQLVATAGAVLSPPERPAPIAPALASPLNWQIGGKKEGRNRAPAATVQRADKCSPQAGSAHTPVAQTSPEPGDDWLVRDARAGDSDACHAL